MYEASPDLLQTKTACASTFTKVSGRQSKINMYFNLIMSLNILEIREKELCKIPINTCWNDFNIRDDIIFKSNFK